jgi:hypothetical protein
VAIYIQPSQGLISISYASITGVVLYIQASIELDRANKVQSEFVLILAFDA